MMSNLNQQAPIFISYARDDAKDFAERLHDDLELRGLNAWLDFLDIKSGDWDEPIEQALDECQALLFIMSPKSIVSTPCKNEWSHVLYKRHGNVIPLLYSPELSFNDLPFGLHMRNGIDFRGDYEPAIAKLVRWLKEPTAPSTRLEQIADEIAQLDDDPAPNVAERRAYLQTQLANFKAQVADPEGVRAGDEKRLAEMLERERERFAQAARQRRSSSFERIVGSPPQDVSERFKDRHNEQQQIKEAISGEATRLLMLVGQGGVGKTALACKVLDDLQADTASIRGLIYLSAQSAQLSLDAIFSRIGRMLGREEELQAVYSDMASPLTARLSKLLAALERDDTGRYILLLDNLESIQDDDGTLQDPDLSSFIHFVLTRRSALRILITTRVPLKIPQDGLVMTRLISLDNGLPTPYAVQMLRELDPNNEAKLKDAPETKLIRLAERLHGYPRALEGAAARLRNEARLTLDKLLAQAELLREPITENMMRDVLSKLNPEAERLMAALAIYNRPVTEAALFHLLAPFQTLETSESALDRLIELHLVSFDKGRGACAIHPIDRAYSYGKIPAGSEAGELGADYTQKALASRAADFYRGQRLQKSEWRNMAALEPHLAEIELRTAAGEYDQAARIVDLIDFDYLLRWGQAKRVKALREPLLDKLTDPDLAMGNYGHLQLAYQALGLVLESIHLGEAALRLAREAKNRGAEGALLGNLGSAYSDLGEVRKAIDFYEQALAISREIGDRSGEGALLGNLGSAYSDLGEVRKAIDFYEQALAIAREIGDRSGEGALLGNLGIAYSALGETRKAIDFYEQALAISREIGHRGGEGIRLGNLGNAYSDLGEVRKAIDFYGQALAISREIGHRQGEGNRLGNLGNAYSDLGEVSKAIDHYEQALTISREIGDRRLEGNSLGNLGIAYRDIGELNKAAELGREAVQIVTEIEDARFCSGHNTYLAKTYLLMNELQQALAVAQTATTYDVPENNHAAHAILGLAQLRVEDRAAAQASLQIALQYADDLLAKTPNLYEALYYKGTILAALACLHPSETYRARAAEAYQQAAAIFNGAGIIGQQKQLLSILSAAGCGDFSDMLPVPSA